MPSLTNKTVLLFAILAFLLPIAYIEYLVLLGTNGTPSYPIDDSFIHLAIAKNIAFHYNWGIDSNHFVSASSSLIYPLVLAAVVKIFGASALIPLMVNVISGIVLIVVVQKWLSKKQLAPLPQLLILLGLVILTPLPVLAIAGMEHMLQLLFCFLFITSFAQNLEDCYYATNKEWRLSSKVLIYAALFVATRYEAIPMIGFACLLLLFYRKYVLAWQLLTLSLLPVILFGIIAIWHGNYFFPNSVLLKSGMPPMTVDGLIYFFTDMVFMKLSYSIVGYNTIATQRISLLLPIVFLMFFNQVRPASAYRTMLILLICSVLTHLAVTGYAHFPRYEAYLIGNATIVTGAVIAKYGVTFLSQQKPAFKYLWIFTLTLLIFPTFMRSRTAFGEIRQACINIYEQQYQMGRFLHHYYYNEKMALGDIGAVSYLTAGNIIDLVGLANIDIARSRRGNYNSPDYINSLAQKEQVKIAIVYDVFNDPQLLHKWDKIATWQIQNNVACGSDIVSFYAVDTLVGPGLMAHLKEFQRSLPEGVMVRYY